MVSNFTLIHEFLEFSADRFPEKTAIVDGAERVTYGELDAMANRLARSLMEFGVKPGDRCVILLPNSAAYVISYYAVLKCGGVAVPLSTDLKPDGLTPVLTELEARIVIASHRHERLLKAVDSDALSPVRLLLLNPRLTWSETAIHVQDWHEAANSGEPERPKLDLSGNSLASIIYTSGSEGKPKGVMLSHANIVANTQSICQYLRITSNDRQMVVLPFFYVMGKSLLNTHIAAGATVVINNQFAFPATVIKQMAEEKITAFSGVPSTYAYLLHRSPLAAYRDKLPHLRYCSQAGGHMAHTMKMELRKMLPPRTEIFIMYGATEAAARLTYLPPDQLTKRVNSIGKAIPGVALSIRGTDGQSLPDETAGELIGQGPNIMMGYWKDPVATAKALGPQGYCTGDLGYRDRDGYYYITGRKDNQLKVSGHRINTQEIEDALAETGLAVQTAVVGLPDSMLGHRLVALAIPREEKVDPSRMQAACAALLPRFKVPEIVTVKNLPLNANGKIDKGRCLKIVEKHFKDNTSAA